MTDIVIYLISKKDYNLMENYNAQNYTKMWKHEYDLSETIHVWHEQGADIVPSTILSPKNHNVRLWYPPSTVGLECQYTQVLLAVFTPNIHMYKYI